MYSARSVPTFREYPTAFIFVLSWCTGDCKVPGDVGGAVLSDYTASHATRQRSSKNVQHSDLIFINLRRVQFIYGVIHKSLRDFRTRLRNNQDRHGKKEHINR